MKKVIFIFLFIVASMLVNAQTGSSSKYYHYKFKIQDITNLAEAKPITDELRKLFKTYPTFVDSADVFEFISPETIAQPAFDDIVVKQGYRITPLIISSATPLEIKAFLDDLNEE